MHSRSPRIAAQYRHAAAAALSALALLALAPSAFSQAAVANTKAAKKPDAVVLSTPDTELLLRGCAGEAYRNAKLYVARAHGIELMKRSADRDQGRSMLRIEAQLDGTLSSLKGKGGVDAELDRMEDALVGLTELTLQQPLPSQVEAVLRLADRAAQACSAAVGKLGYDKANAAAPSHTSVRQLAVMLHSSQQLAGNFLAASLKSGGPTAAESAALVKLANAFDADLGLLRPAGIDDASLRDMLTLIDGQWLFVRQAISRPRENARSKIEDVGRASELMFEVIDREMLRQRRRG
jgi:hypothetical protein